MKARVLASSVCLGKARHTDNDVPQCYNPKRLLPLVSVQEKRSTPYSSVIKGAVPSVGSPQAPSPLSLEAAILVGTRSVMPFAEELHQDFSKSWGFMADGLL